MPDMPDEPLIPAAGTGRVSVFVNGTLMRGEPLHANLAGAVFRGPARTRPWYRLLSVRDIHPAMIEVGERQGVAISGELYELTLGHLKQVLEQEPSGLGIGVVDLEGGTQSLGILWMAPGAPAQAADISAFGGWREYRDSL